MDIFGDHSVSCNGISCVPRHNLVAEALASAALSAGITIEREVAVAGKERPADLLLKSLHSCDPLAVDVTIVRPLVLFDQGAGAGHSRTADAEKAKHSHYDGLCRNAGFDFKAFGVSTFGGLGPEAVCLLQPILARISESLPQAEGQIACRQASEKIVVACLRGVGQQLLASFEHFQMDVD